MNPAHKLVTQRITYYPYTQQSHVQPIQFHDDHTLSTMNGNNNTTDANEQQQSVSITSTTVDDKEYSEKSVSPCTPLSSDSSPLNDHDHGEFLIFLDWDDTLYPSTQMIQILNRKNQNGFVFVTEEEREQWNELGIQTLSLLRRVIYKYGAISVHIVSNSEAGWIQQSLQYAQCISKIYTDIAILLVQNNITMISAQSEYATKVPHSNPTKWKILCFTEILNGNKFSYSHILSIGDQWLDHHAAIYSIATLKYTPLHHMIKVKEEPNLKDMMNEMLYIQTAFDFIFSGDIIGPVIMDYCLEETQYIKANTLKEDLN